MSCFRLFTQKTTLLLIALFVLSPTMWAAEGLKVHIINAEIGDDLQTQVTFRMEDNNGAPIELDQVSSRFNLARLDVLDADKGIERYFSYITRIETVPEGVPGEGNTAVQATSDRNGEYTRTAPGQYVYTFDNLVPAEEFDPAKTHTITGQFERQIGEKEFFANPIYHFVPNGSEVTQLRQVVTNEACNKCHNGLGIHGGGRRDITMCISCHSPQSTDANTGNTVDMAVMIHKIHRGADLPSVQAGGEYAIYGYRNSKHDYSHVHFPMDIRNCDVCHAGPEGDVYKTAITRMNCGSCHDHVNFETGENHGPGIPQMNDDGCIGCHQPEGEEFGLAVAGAHTVPYKSQKLKGLNAEIVEVLNAQPGMAPTVRFTLTEDDGTIVDAATIQRLRILMAGPAKEYTHYLNETANAATLDGDVYTYTFESMIPADAMGTYAFSIESRRPVVLVDNPEGEEDIEVTESAENPVKYVSLDQTPPMERRQIVSLDKCNACHDKINFHGNQRNQIDYCVMCHNPKKSDIGRRPEDVMGGVSVSFAYMIHKIHTGEELHQDYTVYGYGQRAHNYNHLLFSGKRNRCGICHVDANPQLPIAPENEPIEFLDKDEKMVHVAPTTAKCTSCHDMTQSIAHAELNTTQDGVESCAVCHREGRSASIAKAHMQKEFTNVIEQIGPLPTNIQHWTLYQ